MKNLWLELEGETGFELNMKNRREIIWVNQCMQHTYSACKCTLDKDDNVSSLNFFTIISEYYVVIVVLISLYFVATPEYYTLYSMINSNFW